MIQLDVYSTITDRDESVMCRLAGMGELAFSTDNVRQALDSNPEDKDVKLNIHCNGGSVDEGFAIYDILRTSGKNIYANIEGNCHSMAIMLLLAAPLENRTGNPNCKAFVHPVQVQPWGDSYSANDLLKIAYDMMESQNSILDHYVDRTGADRDKLANLMENETLLNAEELLELGFIGKINNYNTNQKSKKMNGKKKESGLSNFLKGAKNLLRAGAHKSKNQVFHDDGAEAFSLPEGEEIAVGVDVLEGSEADGVHHIEETGEVVTIENGEITGVADEDSEAGSALEDANIDEMQATIDEQNAYIAKLQNSLQEALDYINELQKETKTNSVPRPRVNTPITPGNKRGNANVKKSAADIKEDMQNSLNLFDQKVNARKYSDKN